MPKPRSTATPAWPTAVLGSVGLHAVTLSLLAQMEWQTRAAPQGSPLSAYVAALRRPMPGEPGESDVIGAEPPSTMPVPQPTAQPAAEAAVPDEPPAAAAAPEPRGSPEKDAVPGGVDWAAAQAAAVARMREQARREARYRSFGYPKRPSGPTEPPSPSSRASVRPLRDPARRRETTSWGEQRGRLNETCYESSYAPGSVLADVHRFSNVFVRCENSAPDDSRDDLFSDIRRGYLRGDWRRAGARGD